MLELNELLLDGSLKNRADYPRAWEKIQSLGTALVTDTDWNLASAVTANGQTVPYPNRGKFSTGDGSTTFRLPDWRGMGVMGLIAGTDNDRVSNTPGNYMKHMVEQHNHVEAPYNKAGAKASDTGGSGTPGSTDSVNATSEYKVGGMSSSDWTNATIKDYGGSKTVMDNIGIYWKIKV